jgi:hypothetical protein
MVCVGGTGWLLYDHGGARFRTAKVNAFLDNFSMPFFYERENLAAVYRSECNFYKMGRDGQPLDNHVPRTTLDARCHIKRQADDKAVFLWGDSHAAMLSYGIENNLPAGWELLVVATSGCTPLADVPADAGEELCAGTGLRSPPRTDPARSGGRGPPAPHARALHRHGGQAPPARRRRVVFMGPTPQFELPLPTLIARRAMVGRR